MSHESAHANDMHHGFIQMHLVGAFTATLAQEAATAVNAQKATLPGVHNASPLDGTVLVYVEFTAPPAPWDPNTRKHVPANQATPAHARILALRQLIANTVKKQGTPFFDFGLSHNWCCYGDS